MSVEVPPIIPDEILAVAPPVPEQRAKSPSRFRRALLFPLKFFWGMLFCQGLASSILVVGWTYRLAQRSVFKQWWKRGHRWQHGGIFTDFLLADERTKPHAHWPNWFFRQNFSETLHRSPGSSFGEHARSLLAAPMESLWENFWTGLRGILNTWALTLPACLFWWFGWYDGWNNSFNKGYEQAAVGPVISVLGIFLFIAAMFYLPLAQARQAATGDWRSFYEFRTLWRIVRLRWLAVVGLAALYSLVCLPLTILKTYPMYAPQTNAALERLGDTEAVHYLSRYFFWCGAVMLPAYVLLRLVAARIYASGILAAVQTGRLPATTLAENERAVLERLDLLRVRPQPERHLFVRFIAWTGTVAGRTTAAFVAFWVWFSFVAQIYVAEFLKYHTALGWINQPLVQLPWFRYVPPRLRNPMADVGIALLVVLAAVFLRLAWHKAARAGLISGRRRASPSPR